MLNFFKNFTVRVLFVAVAVMAIANSCEPIGEDGLSVSTRPSKLVPNGGQIWVIVTAEGDWTLSLEFSDGDQDWARLSANRGTGSISTIILDYDAFPKTEDGGERSLRIVLSSKGQSASCTVVQTSKAAGEDDNLPDDVSGWMEMPETYGSLSNHYHSFEYKGTRYRNYSFGWDAENKVAHWVAYPLCKLYTVKNVDRTDAWNYDPKVPQNEQPVLFKGFYGSLYDRGHQLPSADRLCCYEANAQTFYFTNMTPQIDKFNQRIWANLEDKVRVISGKCDTLYVVTGCVISDDPSYANDNNRNNVAIPEAYFKALLYYNKSNSSIGVGGFQAAGWYLEHRSYATDNVDASMLKSIDELEELTGMDFFVNLPGKIGEKGAAAVEAEDPSNVSVWK